MLPLISIESVGLEGHLEAFRAPKKDRFEPRSLFTLAEREQSSPDGILLQGLRPYFFDLLPRAAAIGAGAV